MYIWRDKFEKTEQQSNKPNTHYIDRESVRQQNNKNKNKTGNTETHRALYNGGIKQQT